MKKKKKGQALIIVLLVAAICLVVVGSLALRTAKRIQAARKTKESQIAYGSALTGVEAALAEIQSGELDLGDCSADAPCGLSTEEYLVQIYPEENEAGENMVSIQKDRAVDLWIPGEDADTLNLTCTSQTGPTKRGVTVTVVYTPDDPADDYVSEKYAVACRQGQSWGFYPCGSPDECHIVNRNIYKLGYYPTLARIKAFSDDSDDAIAVSAQILDGGAGGTVVASTAGYRIDSTGFGYEGTSSTISVLLSPSALPYPFDFALYSGAGQQ